MKRSYENTLKVIYQGDPDLAELIRGYIEKFPKAISDKMAAYKPKGVAIEDGKRWSYEDSDSKLSISLEKANDSHKEHMILYLTSIIDEKLRCWPRFEGEKLIGYITLFLYDETNQKSKPAQVNYDFYVRRVGKKLMMNVTTNFNGHLKDNRALLEKYGMAEMHENVVAGYYEIDTSKILPASR